MVVCAAHISLFLFKLEMRVEFEVVFELVTLQFLLQLEVGVQLPFVKYPQLF